MSLVRPMSLLDLLDIHRCNLDPFTETFDVDYYLNYLSRWPSLCRVAVDRNGRVEAYVIGKIESSSRPPPISPYSPETNPDPNYLPWHGHITALSVAPGARRLGHASTLSGEFARICDRNQAWFMDLFVRADNKPAQELYRKLGYSVFRRVVKYYSSTTDALDMRKPLTRDVRHRHIRRNGESVCVQPSEL